MFRPTVLSLLMSCVSLSAFAQHVFASNDTTLYNTHLVLDSVWASGVMEHHPMDEPFTESYLDITDNTVVLKGRSRGRSFFYEGSVKGIEQRYDDQGNQQAYFYLLPAGDKARSIILQLTQLPSGKVHIHAYNPLGSFDRLFIAHTENAD